MKRLLRFGLLLEAMLVPLLAAFGPPTAQERAAALGNLDDMPPALRRLLTPDEDINLIPLPEPGDWLAEHSEGGQTFDEYKGGGANRPDATRAVIYLLPMGEFPRGRSPSLETLRGYASAYFQMEVKVLPNYAPAVMEFDPRVNPQSKQVQVLTKSILKFLESRLPSDAFCLLGITMQDLYPTPSWNYVFGQASLVERIGVYSFARFDPDFFGEERPKDYRALMLRRACKILVHETGHMFGLRHCIYYDCVMNGSNSLAESDAKPMQLCPICLRKLQYGTGFDAVKRYAELARFYRKQHWDADAEWCERQAAKSRP